MIRRVRSIALWLSGLALFPPLVLAGDGHLDLRFGTNQTGIERVSFDQGFFNRDEASDVLVLQDGSIVLVGTVDVAGGTGLGIARLTSEGTPHQDGNAVVASEGFFLRAAAVAQSNDGMLLVAGSYFDTVAQEGPFWLVCRMAADGEPDPTFGGNGVHEGCATGFADGIPTEGVVNDVVVQPDGRIVAGGVYISADQIERAALSALTPLGMGDAGFADDGIGADNLAMPFPSLPFASSFRALRTGPDGTLVAAGAAAPVADNDILVARYTTDGDPQMGFGMSGRVLVPFNLGPPGAFEDVAEGVVLLPDGGVCAAGSAQIDEDEGSAGVVFKLEPDGDLDATFFTGGKVVIAFPGTVSIRFNDLAVDPSGRPIPVGTAIPVDNPASGLVLAMRFTPAGLLDPTFVGGLQVFAFDTVPDFPDGTLPSTASAVALQDRHVLVAGTVRGPINQFDNNFAVARLGNGLLLRDGFELTAP